MATALKNKLMDFIRPLIDLPKLKHARLWSFGLTKSFQRNLLLSIGGVFLLFAVCFSVYQYQRKGIQNRHPALAAADVQLRNGADTWRGQPD